MGIHDLGPFLSKHCQLLDHNSLSFVPFTFKPSRCTDSTYTNILSEDAPAGSDVFLAGMKVYSIIRIAHCLRLFTGLVVSQFGNAATNMGLTRLHYNVKYTVIYQVLIPLISGELLWQGP